MKHHPCFHPMAAAAWFCVAGGALAQGIANEAELERVVVSANRSQLATQLPSTSAGKTAEQLRQQNVFNPEDALQYVPNTTVRKRYLGDRNGLIGGRNFGTLQPSRALVYVDGYLISNFLGRFDAPRWNMVTPEAIERVDVLYGPYSALYPGNSIGTTVAVALRKPKALEISARVIGYQQHFEQYGHKDRLDGHQLSVRGGTRLDSGLWLTADLNHQSSTSQPMQYANIVSDAAGAFPAVIGAATPVSGIVYDRDPKGLRRAVFGANGGAIDHTVQDTLNLRAGYRITPYLEAGAMAALWRNETDNTNKTFLRDAAGNAIWSGFISDIADPTLRFSIPASSLAPSTRYESHRQLGFTLRTRHDAGWNGSVVASDYRIRSDVARQASSPDPLAAAGGPGNVTRRDGTGWYTFEVQTTRTPTRDDGMFARHALALGLHYNGYVLDNTVDGASDWRGSDTTLAQFARGKTRVAALYVQDAWSVSESVKLTLGLREEHFRTFDGAQLLPNGAHVPYGARSLRGRSPKAALAWDVGNDWLLKASYGRGVRFPNVEELYNATATATSVTVSDPNLKPEVSNALELSGEKDWQDHHLRVSLFFDEVRDAILRQSDTTVSPAVTRVSNVDKVRTAGLEVAWQAVAPFFKGLSVEASAAYTHSKVLANARDPASAGKWWLRVPRMRATLQLAYRPNDRWMFSANYRHEGRAWNDVYNLDVNPDVYGGVSRVRNLDIRASHELTQQVEAAVGINNVANRSAYQSHPYPGRTVFAELRFKH